MASKEDDDQIKDDKADGSDENFGLPDLEYKPLDQPSTSTGSSSSMEHASEPEPEPVSSTPTDSFDAYAVDEAKSRAPLIITVVIVLVVAITGYLIYNYVYLPGEAKEKARKEEAARLAKEKKEEADRIAREKAAEEQRLREEAQAKATPKEGTIEVLSARTRRYYVVITSDIDDDLLMDYAKKLSATGVNLKVIPPFGGKQFYRLAIADHDTFAQAQSNADAAKATYGNGVWVIKY